MACQQRHTSPSKESIVKFVLSKTALLIALCVVVSCTEVVPQDTTSLATSGEVTSPLLTDEATTSLSYVVDFTTITTFADFENVRRDAWNHYEVVQKQAWKDYLDAEKASFTSYQTTSTAALRQLRTDNYEAYLAWLDAEKLADHERRRELESTVAEIATYVAANDIAFINHRTKKDAAYTQYTITKANAYDSYVKTKNAAYAAYRSFGTH